MFKFHLKSYSFFISDTMAASDDKNRKNITGYIHTTSPMKKAQSGREYFEAIIQQESQNCKIQLIQT